jgi:hypothetical protein
MEGARMTWWTPWRRRAPEIDTSEPPVAVAAAKAVIEAGEAERAMGLVKRITAAGMSARASRQLTQACTIFGCAVVVVPPGFTVQLKPMRKEAP